MIFKNSKIQKENIEIKFQYAIIRDEKENNINNIKNLENQVKLRDSIIKELLYLENINPNYNNLDNNNKSKINAELSKLFKNEKVINPKIISELKNKGIYSEIKIKRKISEMNRPRSISINKKSKLSQNKIFNQNTKNNFEEDYIIDYDKDDSKINNSYLKSKIPYLEKSNSSFNIYNYDNNLNNLNILKKPKNKKSIKNYKDCFFSNDDIKKRNNKKNEYNINYKSQDNEINNINKNSNNKINSMLKEIKNMNTDISSKFTIIENQSNRNIAGISKLPKGILKEKINPNKNINNNNMTENNNLKNNDNTIENDKTINNNNNNYSINCQMINSNISNRKNNIKNSSSKNKLLKSENNKNNNNIRIFNPKDNKSTTILGKMFLSQGKSQNKENNTISKGEISKIKKSFIKDLEHNNSSYINSSNKNSNKKYTSERNKSFINRIPNNKNNKKEVNNYACINNKNPNISIRKNIIDKDIVPFIDDISISQYSIEKTKKNSNKNIIKDNNIRPNSYFELNNNEINKYSFNNKYKSFNFQKRAKEKNQK